MNDNNLKSIKNENDLALYREFLDKDINSFTEPKRNGEENGTDCINQLLRSLIGKNVRVQFMSTGSTVWRYGTLKSVGQDYFVIKNPSSRSNIICYTKNVLFLNEVPTKFRSNQRWG